MLLLHGKVVLVHFFPLRDKGTARFFLFAQKNLEFAHDWVLCFREGENIQNKCFVAAKFLGVGEKFHDKRMIS